MNNYWTICLSKKWTRQLSLKHFWGLEPHEDWTENAFKAESLFYLQKCASIILTSSQSTYNQTKSKHRKQRNNHFSASINFSDKTATLTRSSRHRSKSLSVLNVNTLQGHTFSTGSKLSFTSSSPIFSPFSSKFYDPGHLAPMRSQLAQKSLAQLFIIRSKNTKKLTEVRTPSDNFKGRCNHFDCFSGCGRGTSSSPNRILSCRRRMNFLLLSRKTRAKVPTGESPESTYSFRKITASTTGSAACIIEIGTYQ